MVDMPKIATKTTEGRITWICQQLSLDVSSDGNAIPFTNTPQHIIQE